MMKKFFFSSPLTAAILAALTFAACSQSDTIADGNSVNNANNAPQAVEFDTYMGQDTRDVQLASYTKGMIGNKDADFTTDLKKARFGVFAYYTGTTNYVDWSPSSKAPNFMFNEELQWSTSNPTDMWIYEPVKYWPNGIDAANAENDPSNTAIEKDEGQKLSFFAFAPYTATPTTDYSVTSDGSIPTGLNEAKIKKNDKTNGVVAMTNNASESDVWVKYEMTNAQADEAVDLLWGLRGSASYSESDNTPSTGTVGAGYNVDLTKQTVPERVKFLFKHALAKVGGSTATETESADGDPKQCGFKVVVDVDKNSGTINGESNQQTLYFASNFDKTKTLVTIKEVKIQDGASAYADRANNGMTTETYSNLNTFGWFNIEKGTWSSDPGTFGQKTANTGATYSVTANSTNETLDDKIYALNEDIKEPTSAQLAVIKGEGTWTGDGSIGKPNGVDIGTPKPLFANENVPGLLIIPGGSADLYITVDYLVRTADTKLAQGYTEVEQVITNKVSLGSLNPNKYYTIIMHLGLTSVKFEAVVADWETHTGGTFDEKTGEYTSSGEENNERVWLPSNVVANGTALTVSIHDGNIPATGTLTKQLTVKLGSTDIASTNYTVTIPAEATWLTVSNGVLTATENEETTSRNATVTVSYTDADGIHKGTVTVTQDGVVVTP